jgi:hypothetical protein
MKQQQVAMRLAKAAGQSEGGDRYMWWAVTSLLLQARAAAAGDTHTCQLAAVKVGNSVPRTLQPFARSRL